MKTPKSVCVCVCVCVCACACVRVCLNINLYTDNKYYNFYVVFSVLFKMCIIVLFYLFICNNLITFILLIYFKSLI